MSAPVVDVVVLTWNDGELLDLAVRSALHSGGVEVRVWVIDNASDEPARTTDGDPRVVVVRNDRNRGVAPARNQGVALGTAPYVCLLDSDAALLGGALATLVDALAEPGVGCAVPVFADQVPEASAGRAPDLADKMVRGLNRRSVYRSCRPAGAVRWDVDFGIGACQVFRREAFAAVDGLDESFFYGPEDVDFCLRLRGAGWRTVQCADATVNHPPRRRFRKLASSRGAAHAWAIVRYSLRHRRFVHLPVRP
jgi:N-acetylglucosaminyl-diphospho-decaprenol L-rhamnosyltransferase